MNILRAILGWLLPSMGFCAAAGPSLQIYGLEPFVQYAPPNVDVAELKPASGLSSFATPGQYEPFTCGIYSAEGVDDVAIVVTDLTSGAAVIPSAAIDLRILKYWFQRGPGWRGRRLIPDPMFHDDRLISIDLDRKENILHFKGLPLDPPQLAPFDVPPNTLKQLWVTVHVPEAAAAGTYQGYLVFKRGPLELERVSVQLEVLPFTLDPPAKAYGVYFPSMLAPEGSASATVDYSSNTTLRLVSEEIFRKQCADLRAHGITHPQFTLPIDVRDDGTLDLRRVEKTIKIRREYGLMEGPFFASGIPTSLADAIKDPAAQQRYLDQVEQVLRFFAAQGCDKPYIYGLDEAYGDKLKQALPLYKLVKERGGRIAAATYTNNHSAVTGHTPGWLETAGSLLDLPIVAQNLTTVPVQEIRNAHVLGLMLWLYALPQIHWNYYASYEYRNNYGFWLSSSEADGICPWGYQWVVGEPYDDFDAVPEGTITDCFAVYPTKDGIMPTIMWEAYRAGIDDCRYFTTLQNAVAKARSRHGNSPLLDEIANWKKETPAVEYVHVVNDLEQRKDFKPMLVYDPGLKAQLAARPNLQSLRRAYADRITQIVRAYGDL